MASVKVAVRARPLSQRELDMQSKLIIEMNENKTSILNSKLPSNLSELSDIGRERVKEFTYDYSYWSCDPNDPYFASQEQVFQDLGKEVVENAFEGYNSCIFAYGQTGSGKTYTMMGTPESEGLIPRICQALFKRMKVGQNCGTTFRTEVSYLEIYNERVKDLLAHGNQPNLKVREHPKLGPYVQDLSHHYVMDYADVRDFMNRGSLLRTTANTLMNDASSRSHAIFRLAFTQAKLEGDMPSETVSKINLVDLAGSERADATGATGIRLKEGGHINKSLVTLGNVISALADLTCNPKRTVFIPYRDSVLTWLLKDSLGGNSKTVMIATISPAECNYGESLSTLRYASRAKNIINRPTINEDSNVKLIRELRAEIAYLKSLLDNSANTSPKVIEKLQINEARVKVLTEEWAEKWKDIQKILEEQHTLNLRKASSGVVLDSAQPHLIGLDGDVLSTGITLYHLKQGCTTVGTSEAKTKQDIELCGDEIEDEHCVIELRDGISTLIPIGQSQCVVNTIPIDSPTRLSQGCVILLGSTIMFRFNDPLEIKRLRKNRDFAPSPSRCKLSLLSRSVSAMSLDLSHHSSGQAWKEYPDSSMRKNSFHTLKREALLRKGKSQEELGDTIDRKKHLMILREEISRMQEEAHQIENDELNHGRQPGVGSEPENLDQTLIPSTANERKDEDESKVVKLDKLEEKEEDVISRCNSWLDRGVSAQLGPPTEPNCEEFVVKRRNLKSLTDQVNNRRSELGSDFIEDDRRKSFSTMSYFGSDYRDHILPCCEEDHRFWNAKTVKNLEAQILENMKNFNMSSKSPECIENRLRDMKELEKKFMEIEQEMEMRRQFLEQTEAATLSPSSSIVGIDPNMLSREEDEQKKRLGFLVELEVQRRIQEELMCRSLSVETSPQRTLNSCQRSLSMSQNPMQSWKSLDPILRHRSMTSLNYNQINTLNRTKSLDTGNKLNGCGCRITIPSYTIRGSGSAKHYEYEIKIQTVDDHWSLFRRYKRFRELHHHMKQKFGKDVILPYFPPKKLFGSCSEKVVKERQKYLECYLQELVIILGMKSPKSNYNVMQGGLKKQELVQFSPFFQKGCFEVTKHGTG